MFRNKASFYSEELSAPRPTAKQEDHPLSAVREFLVNIFAPTPPYRRQFIRPQREDAPCRGDNLLFTEIPDTRHAIHINLCSIVKNYISISDKLEMWAR